MSNNSNTSGSANTSTSNTSSNTHQSNTYTTEGVMQGIKETLHNVGTAMGLTKPLPLDSNEKQNLNQPANEPRMSGATTAGLGPTPSAGMNSDMASQGSNRGHLNQGSMGTNTSNLASAGAGSGASCCANGCKCGSNCTCGSGCSCASCGGFDKAGKLNQQPQQQQGSSTSTGTSNKASGSGSGASCCGNGCKCGNSCNCGENCSCNTCSSTQQDRSGKNAASDVPAGHAQNAQTVNSSMSAQKKAHDAVVNAGQVSGNERRS